MQVIPENYNVPVNTDVATFRGLRTRYFADQNTEQAYLEATYNERVIRHLRIATVAAIVLQGVYLKFGAFTAVVDASDATLAVWWTCKIVPLLMMLALLASLHNKKQVDMSAFAWRPCLAMACLVVVHIGILMSTSAILFDTLNSIEDQSEAFVLQTQAHWETIMIFTVFATTCIGTAGFQVSFSLQVLVSVLSILSASGWCIATHVMLSELGHPINVGGSLRVLIIMALASAMILLQRHDNVQHSMEQFQKNLNLSVEIASKNLLAKTSAKGLEQQVDKGTVEILVKEVFSGNKNRAAEARRQIGVFKEKADIFVPLTAGDKTLSFNSANKAYERDYDDTRGHQDTRRLMWLAAAKRGLEVAMNWAARVEGIPTWQMGQKVFLGGSCNPTMWRKTVAIPTLEKEGAPHYNPQVDDWIPELVEI